MKQIFGESFKDIIQKNESVVDKIKSYNPSLLDSPILLSYDNNQGNSETTFFQMPNYDSILNQKQDDLERVLFLYNNTFMIFKKGEKGLLLPERCDNEIFRSLSSKVEIYVGQCAVDYLNHQF